MRAKFTKVATNASFPAPGPCHAKFYKHKKYKGIHHILGSLERQLL